MVSYLRILVLDNSLADSRGDLGGLLHNIPQPLEGSCSQWQGRRSESSRALPYSRSFWKLPQGTLFINLSSKICPWPDFIRLIFTWVCRSSAELTHLLALQAVQNAFMEELFRDTLSFAGAVIIRRILGIAHVIDFESIQDADTRCSTTQTNTVCHMQH